MNIFNRPKDFKKRLSKRKIFSFLVILIALVLGVYLWAKNDDSEDVPETESAETLYLNPQSDLAALSPTSGEVRGNEAVLGEQTTQPVQPSEVPAPVQTTSPSESSTRVYGNKQLGFSVAVPGNWTIQPGSGEVVFVTPQSSRYSVQRYSVRGSQQSLRNFLEAQPNISGVVDASIVGQQGFAFNISGLYGHGFAFMLDNQLYYLLGSGIEDSAIVKTFKLL
jgi:hypothetical protein